MGNDLISFSQPPERRRLTKTERALVQRAEDDRNTLLFEARKQEFTTALRKRLSENALYDVRDVAELAQDLAGGDQFLAAMLIPIVQEFTRQTTREVRNFGNGRGF